MSSLGHAQLCIAPSTGPLHIANALGVKTLGIYSPLKVQSTKRWRPFFGIAQASKTISPAVECPENVHCAGEKCPFYECMSKISVEETFKLGQDLLS
jgi:ADP-heptose:LPS heptosyltransferase